MSDGNSLLQLAAEANIAGNDADLMQIHCCTDLDLCQSLAMIIDLIRVCSRSDTLERRHPKMEGESVEVGGIHFHPGINVAESGASTDEEPPVYGMIDVSAESDGPLDMPPLDYDMVMALPAGTAAPVSSNEMDHNQPKGSLIAEAPPSYREIYGNKKTETTPPQTKRWRRTQRPHTISRRHQTGSNTSNPNALSRLFSCLPSGGSRILIVSIALFILVLPLSMVIVGSVNLNTCSTKDIPLYLIIAGSSLCIEIVVHTITLLVSMNTDSESVLRSLRMCDCFAFFILVWVLIGSNWVFKVTMNSRSCSSQRDAERELFIDNFTEPIPDVTPITCEDCSNAVYQFAVGLIVLQYIIVLFVFVICCCFALRKRTQ